MRLASLPGVFRPIGESYLLAEVIRNQTLPSRAEVLDLCTGTGILAVTAARRGVRSVTAVDISRRAVATARLNARLNGVAVDVRRGDLFAGLDGRRFDLVVANPPYVPVGDARAARGGERAWAAGPDGRAILDRILEGLPRHLRPGGVVLLAHSSIVTPAGTLDALRALGLDAEIVARRTYAFGPVLTAQAAALETSGAIGAGQRHEQVLVFRGRARAAARRPRVARTVEPALR